MPPILQYLSNISCCDIERGKHWDKNDKKNRLDLFLRYWRTLCSIETDFENALGNRYSSKVLLKSMRELSFCWLEALIYCERIESYKQYLHLIIIYICNNHSQRQNFFFFLMIPSISE